MSILPNIKYEQFNTTLTGHKQETIIQEQDFFSGQHKDCFWNLAIKDITETQWHVIAVQ